MGLRDNTWGDEMGWDEWDKMGIYMHGYGWKWTEMDMEIWRYGGNTHTPGKVKYSNISNNSVHVFLFRGFLCVCVCDGILLLVVVYVEVIVLGWWYGGIGSINHNHNHNI